MSSCYLSYFSLNLQIIMKLVGFSFHSILESESNQRVPAPSGLIDAPLLRNQGDAFWKTILDKVTPKLETLPTLP